MENLQFFRSNSQNKNSQKKNNDNIVKDLYIYAIIYAITR